jgi:hypothetical protein
VLALPKRIVLGRRFTNDRMGETLLPKYLALPVFCSDPLSSVAYATEQIVLVLGLGGLALLHLTPWVALGVVALLVIVVASYRQTCHAYPDGGGAYAVSRANLGPAAALVAASALLVDYVLTVAVSVVAGVAAVTSAESGRVFAIPTYGFIFCIGALLGVGAWRIATGHPVVAESATYSISTTNQTAGALVVFLVLRAFASGCTALTGGQPAAAAARGVGAGLRHTEQLPARLHGAAPPQARTRPLSTAAPDHRSRDGIPLRALALP